MDLEFKTFGEVAITPQYGSYSCKLVISDVDEMEAIQQIDTKTALSNFNTQDIIDYLKEQGYDITE